MGRTCGAYWGGERCAQGSSGKPEGKRPLGRSRRRMEDNITTDPGWSIGSHVFISGNLSVLNGKAKKFITQD